MTTILTAAGIICLFAFARWVGYRSGYRQGLIDGFDDGVSQVVRLDPPSNIYDLLDLQPPGMEKNRARSAPETSSNSDITR